ncbi:VOC family protein [Nocardia sp. NPDC101769]|uniref:VOC family protein n=1 Tax=Nocardia sp. NPDC101769 TaxID=3364333 RepID=UPI00382AFE00
MSITFDHTIIWATDKAASATFLAHILGVEVGPRTGPFLPVRLDNDVTLDYADTAEPRPQHYAFTVDAVRFTAALARIQAAGVPYYADPFHRLPGRTNSDTGGRGIYFADPDGHNMELLTTPC